MNKKKIFSILEKLKKEYPKPNTGLKYNSTFELLISIILSAQSNDIQVNKITKKLYSIAYSPEKIISLGINKLQKYIKTVGLYRNKANFIMQTCHILVNKYRSTVPSSEEDLLSLPGVGRKTANLILNIIFEQPTIAVDRHVLRVSNRIGFVKEKNPEIVEKILLSLVPYSFKKDFHHLIVLHGKNICKSKKPKCINCSIGKLCKYPKKYFKN